MQEQIDGLLADFLFTLESAESAKTRSALALDYDEAEVLEATILKLRVNAERADRQKLEVNATDLRSSYDLAKAELDRLIQIESQLASISLSSVKQPAQPSGPVSRQWVRNIALAMFLGLAFGVTAALLVDYYRIKPARATPIR